MASTTTRKRTKVTDTPQTFALYERYVLGTARFMEIPTKDLYVDHRYQRDINHPAIKRMTAAFSLELFEPPTVNDRSGWDHYRGQRFALLDGQHRKVVAQNLKMPSITCRIVTVSPETEAELFVQLNRQRIWLSPIQAFKAELRAGNPAVQEIVACLAERGLQVGNPNGSGHGSNYVACVSAMKRIYAQSGYVGLARSVDVARLSWPEDDRQRFSGSVLLGVHTYLANNPKVDLGRLSEKLANVTARHLQAKGTARWHAWQGLGEKKGKSVVDAISDEIMKAYRKR